MRADDINGITEFDRVEAEHEHRQMMADRLQDFAPAPASPYQGHGMPVKTGATAGTLAPGRGRVPRIFTGDELAAQAALRPRSGNVSPMGPCSATFVPVHLPWESYKHDGATAGTGRAV